LSIPFCQTAISWISETLVQTKCSVRRYDNLAHNPSSHRRDYLLSHAEAPFVQHLPPRKPCYRAIRNPGLAQIKVTGAVGGRERGRAPPEHITLLSYADRRRNHQTLLRSSPAREGGNGESLASPRTNLVDTSCGSQVGTSQVGFGQFPGGILSTETSARARSLAVNFASFSPESDALFATYSLRFQNIRCFRVVK
jgi:hypothetical protein